MLVAQLEVQKALFKMGEGWKIVGGEHLPLEDGKIDFDLVEPAGMDRGVHKDRIWPTGPDTMGCLFTAMSRAVVHNPEDPVDRLIRFFA